MSVSWDTASLVQAALYKILSEDLDGACVVRVGWVGNTPFGSHDAVLAIECDAPDTDDHAARVIQHTHPDPEDEPLSQLLLHVGTARANATLNLYTIGARAKTRRAELALQIVNSLSDFKPGYAPGLIVRLDTPEQPYCQFVPNQPVHRDTPEGITREEWRTIIKVHAHLSLMTTIEAPYCRTIQLGDAPENLTPVDQIAED